MKEYRNQQGLLHRTDGPARVWPDGSQEWYCNGQRHRTDGPAGIDADGTQSWWFEDKPHRTDGPAVFWPSGVVEWWFNGRQYDQLTHMLLVNQHNTQTQPQTVVL